MNYKTYWLSMGIISLSVILSGCGSPSTASKNIASTVNKSVENSQQHTKQQTDKSNWLTVHIQQVGQLPVAMVGTSLAQDENEHIIATGGYTGSVSLQSVYQVVPSVRHITNLPQRTHDAASDYIGRDLYVFGGGQATSYNTIVRVKGGVAQTMGTLSQPLSDAVCLPWSSAGTQGLLVVGGYNGQTYRKYADYFQVKNQQLVSTIMFRLPVGLRYTAAVAANGAVYLAGGETPTSVSSAIYRWSPNSGIRILTHLPEGLQKAAVFQTGGFLVVVGGVRSDGRISSDIYAVRLSNGAVKLIGNLPSPLADMGYTQIGTNGYLVGGETGNGYSSKVFKITLG